MRTTPIEPNRPVSPAFIKLKHSINSCINHIQLDTLAKLVRAHALNNPHEADILVEYFNKDGALSPILPDNEIESLHHKRTSWAKN